MIVKRPHTKIDIPPVTPGVERVASMNILGVIFQENMSFTMQVDRLVARAPSCTDGIHCLCTPSLGVHRQCIPSVHWKITGWTIVPYGKSLVPHSYRGSHMRPRHGGGCWMVRSANDCKVSLIGRLRGVSSQAPNQPSQKYATMLTSVFSLQYWKIPITYCITYCHQLNWPRIDCGNEIITGNCPQLRKTRSPEKPSSPDCSCWIVININSDINALLTHHRTITLYINFITIGFKCIYMSHSFFSFLFVNSLLMSEDNKALLTYLLTYCTKCFLFCLKSTRTESPL